MVRIIKVDSYSEFIEHAVESINKGYEFDEIDGSFADGGAIVMLNDDNDKIVLVCEEDTEADMVYTDIYSFMRKACESVFKAYVRSSIYNK